MSKKIDFELLKSCKLFGNIPVENMKNIFNKLHFQVKTYEHNMLIANRNSQCNELLILLSGTVRAEINSFENKTVLIAEIPAIDSLASAFLFGEKNKYPVNIISKKEATVLIVPKTSVIELFKTCPSFLHNFVNRISTRAQYLTEKMNFLSFQTIKSKLSFFILQKSEQQQSDVIKVGITQKAMAEMFGVARQSIVRALKELSEKNIILYKNKNISILKKKELVAMLKYESNLH